MKTHRDRKLRHIDKTDDSILEARAKNFRKPESKSKNLLILIILELIGCIVFLVFIGMMVFYNR